MANNDRVYEYFEAGTYVFSAERIYSVVENDDYDIHVRLQAVNRSGVNSAFVELPYDGDRVRDVVIRTTEDCRFEIVWMASYYDEYSTETSGSLRIEGMQLQKGTKSTSHQDYVKHLTDALAGTTDIAGGLVMTNLIMLKNEQGQVKAGMSGLTDDNPNGEFGDGEFSEGVSFFSGGTYQHALIQAKGLFSQLERLLPILLTKTGIHSKIGPFEVISNTAVAVKNNNGTIIIDSNSGISMLDANGYVRLEIIPQEINDSDISGYKSPIQFNDLQTYEVETSSPTDSNVHIQLGVVSGSGLPSTGNYKVKVTSYKTFIRPYWIKETRGRGGRGIRRETGIFSDDISFIYQIYLKNQESGTTYPLCQQQITTITNGYLEITADSETIINNLPAGVYYVNLVFIASSQKFLEYSGHYYEIYSRPGMEIIALDDVETTGKVTLGTNGMLISAGNSTFILAKTVKNNNSLDVRMLGLPNAMEVGSSPVGQMYLDGNTNAIKIKTTQ